ncbi:hypothetical protein M419DRAFT_100282 [Trichoderma reesei RUT C-30]|uniref:Uncharacterized protein n=1 Tax=Hypocrea jecorina (strain ATCC 56765 / BCRC 32924 / NRRL 11460 / Rut C-30) TaxID=1344414 RepID=A0A024S7G7_HYPJR|nr:hypothetical protein M419DRAFT_100282 [Trichoderma reesei RUT C-30]
MLLSNLLPFMLATCVVAAPVEDIPVAPLVTLYREFGWTGSQFDVRGLDTCVKVANPLYAQSSLSNNCDAATAILYVTTSNSPVNIRRNTDVRSVLCKDMKKKR